MENRDYACLTRFLVLKSSRNTAILSHRAAAGSLWRDVAKRVPVGDSLTRLSWNRVTGIRIHVEYDSVKELLDKVNVDTHDSQSSYEGRVSEPTNETPSLVTQSHTPVFEKGVTALNRVTPTPISVSHSCVLQEGPV